MFKFKRDNYLFLLVSLLLLSVNTRGISLHENKQPEIKQLEKFALNIQESIENGNPSYLNLSFDIDAFLQKIITENSFPDDTAFNKGFQEGLHNNFDIGAMIVDEIKQNGKYSFLHLYQKEGTYFLLFRLFTNNGINYHEFEVKQDNDKFKIIDAYLFLSGEKMSETIARVYNSFRLLNSASAPNSYKYLQALSELGEIKALASKGKYSKAYKKWQKLPSNFTEDKLFLMTGIQIASYLDDKTYLKTYNEFVLNYPNNTGKYLIPLNGFLVHKNYSMAMTCIDSLDKSLDNDPMLNYVRGNLLYEMGNYTEAAKKMSVLIESIPDFETAYYSLLSLYVKDKNYLEATHLLDKIVFTFNYYKDDFSPILKEYPEFINSKEYQAWLNQ
jgi:tetratricopeptide (TPR) repeat protein